MEYNVYFSPTGGTRNSSKCLSPDGIEIDLSARFPGPKRRFGSGDIVFISMPSYQGRVPHFAAERMKELLEGNGALAVLNACYGARAYEDTLIEMHDTVTELGFRTIAVISSITEHSMAREFASGRPDENDRKELMGFRKRIMYKIEGKDFSVPEIPGNRPYRATHAALQPSFDGTKCVKCGECALSCPASAIDEKDCGLTDPGKCMSCTRCTWLCPTGARFLDPVKIAGLKDKLRPACSVYKNNTLAL